MRLLVKVKRREKAPSNLTRYCANARDFRVKMEGALPTIREPYRFSACRPHQTPTLLEQTQTHSRKTLALECKKTNSNSFTPPPLYKNDTENHRPATSSPFASRKQNKIYSQACRQRKRAPNTQTSIPILPRKSDLVRCCPIHPTVLNHQQKDAEAKTKSRVM